MNKEELEKKVIDLYLSSEDTIVQQVKTLRTSKETYSRIIKNKFSPTKIETRNQAWSLFKVVGSSKVLFYRKTGLSRVTAAGVLIGVVFTDEELRTLVDSGVSSSNISEKINMPTIDKPAVRNYLTKKGIHYTKESTDRARATALAEKYKNDPEWVDNKLKRTKETNMLRYRVENVFQSKDIQEKIKQTNMKRYNVPYSSQSKESKEKAAQTNMERYGVANPFQSKDIQEKIKQTNMKRYNVPYSSQSKESKEKAAQTNMERYGFESAMQAPQTKEKIKNTNSTRYGFSNFLQSIQKFNPTKYVKTRKDMARITENPENLKLFLNNAFPEQEVFTLKEISSILGCTYNYISTKFGTYLDFVVPSKQGYLPEQIQLFLEELGYVAGVDFIINDRQAIKPLEIDFYFPKQKVGIEVNDLLTHNSSFTPYLGQTPKTKNYHMEKSLKAKEQGIRLIHAWEHYFNNPQQYEVLKNAIKHALGITSHRVYARNTYVKEVPNVTLKDFFNKNNIQGFRGAKTAYALFDKKTDELLMAYSVGASHFAHNKYDMELIRGASKLDTTIVGGASKLWKFIIDSNPEVNSIVYYIDRNLYNGSSISTLEGNLELISTQVGFWNYFVDTGEMKNRQPGKHKEIKELVAQGKVWEVYNAGTETYVWTRN